MHVGISLPHLGHLASSDAIRRVALAAEASGLRSVWAMDRLLSPIEPRTLAYPGRADGALPDAQTTVIDPVVSLTVAAAVTTRIALGTDVLVAPWYPPVLLARTLAGLDQVSAGRLVVGLGLGWSVDEFEAVGVPMTGRGQRMEDVLDVLSCVWRCDTVDVTTAHERIAPSVMGAKPVQRPRPPILLAASSPAGLDRIARRADGWLPFGISLDEVVAGWSRILRTAERAGRDPGVLRLVVRADVRIGRRSLVAARPPFTGSRGQVLADIERTRALGASEVVLDFQASARTADELLDAALDLSAPALDLAG